ncbi:hypothetical protein [Streptomyces lasiicapitis]|uniref:hypothetical protein n=1 Tax=Streptomyces lasiicapitis TaxID=1923961 RepID=UPI0036829F7C
MIGGLRDNHALYDARSAHRWDLYVAGYYAYGEREYDPQGIPLHVDVGDEPTGWDYRYAQANWWFSPKEFVGPASAVASAHADCLARVPMLRGRRTPWKYSGHPELVNVWVSGRTPDWESLIAREVGEQGPSALSAIVESHAGRPTDPLPREYQPGTGPRAAAEALCADSLRRGLSWAVAGAAGGALSAGATELDQKVIRLL